MRCKKSLIYGGICPFVEAKRSNLDLRRPKRYYDAVASCDLTIYFVKQSGQCNYAQEKKKKEEKDVKVNEQLSICIINCQNPNEPLPPSIAKLVDEMTRRRREEVNKSQVHFASHTTRRLHDLTARIATKVRSRTRVCVRARAHVSRAAHVVRSNHRRINTLDFVFFRGKKNTLD